MILKNSNLKAVSYGEVLFDIFQTEKKIGGAPLNLALRTSSLGIPTMMISCVGNDEDGTEILSYMTQNGLPTEAVQKTDAAPTGLVNVFLNERGSATYDIVCPSAWDFIDKNEKILKFTNEAEIFFYGSLVCRNDTSKQSLFHLLDNSEGTYKVFDVNLRKPHYSLQTLKQLMGYADFIKFNDEELLEVANALGSETKNIESNIDFISKLTGAEAICVTLGKHGSVLLWKNQLYRQKTYTVKVSDTVGAGDSFLASLIANLLAGTTPQESLNFAGAVGALVATKQGANPKITTEEIRSLQEMN